VFGSVADQTAVLEDQVSARIDHIVGSSAHDVIASSSQGDSKASALCTIIPVLAATSVRADAGLGAQAQTTS